MAGNAAFNMGDGAMGKGAKPTRSETVTVRLDPKLRWWAELGARKQRRTVSSFIEWAIETALDRVELASGPDYMTTLKDVREDLWDVEEADRIAKLALRHPDLLTHTEQIIWKLVRETPWLWRGNWVLEGSDKERWKYTTNLESDLIFGRLRELWDSFKQVASGRADKSILPDWGKEPRPKGGKAPAHPAPAPKAKDDDDIPF